MLATRLPVRAFTTSTAVRAAAVSAASAATTAPNADVGTSPATKAVPKPRGSVKDVHSFLYQIGRDSTAVADKFKDWESLFTSNSEQLKASGLNPRQRKYILLWTERYRNGRDLHMIKSSGKRK
ncbi:IGR protein motif-domain-containing protein [Blastocladiella britannica]|nr:IGR protein motif-domain-containing protein [Blastocladiella britannica]